MENCSVFASHQHLRPGVSFAPCPSISCTRPILRYVRLVRAVSLDHWSGPHSLAVKCNTRQTRNVPMELDRSRISVLTLSQYIVLVSLETL